MSKLPQTMKAKAGTPKSPTEALISQIELVEIKKSMPLERPKKKKN